LVAGEINIQFEEDLFPHKPIFYNHINLYWL
jgi:hypothetical protein